VTRTGLNSFGLFTLGNLGSCAAPFDLNTTAITPVSATVNWSALSTSLSYAVDYKPNFSNTWISAAAATTSKSLNLTGLSPSVYYDWRVRNNCSSGSSAYRYSQFRTPVACEDPTGLTTTNISSSSATINWAAVPNVTNYDVEYKQSSANVWTPAVTGTTSLSYNLSGLAAFTSYDWRIRANCSLGKSNYVYSGFTTALPDCNTVYEPNNTSNDAKTIALGTSIYSGISSASDIDWFKVTMPDNLKTGLHVFLSTSVDYDLYVYSKNLVLVGSSVTIFNEHVFIYSGTRKATFYIKVVGKNGTFNNLQCYNLLAETFVIQRPEFHRASPGEELNDGSNSQLLYPNPASEFVWLRFNSDVSGHADVQILSSTGQRAKLYPINLNKGYNQLQIPVSDIKPGMYLLKINKGELSLVRKFVIAR
jgi:hypothetical protein